jgi:hypothetical protein
LVPINRTPPEVLTLIPDFWGKYHRDQNVIALTHVCRAWRGIFTSCSFLWTYFDCGDANKTRVYLERSKSSSINLFLSRKRGLFPHDPFLVLVPDAIGQLRSLTIETKPEHFRGITDHLSHPAPLLEYLSIDGNPDAEIQHNPVLTPALFDGDLSPLRGLRLQSIRTDLPWRNMINLTLFELGYTSPGEISIGQLLDFFESAPHLREVQLDYVSLASGGQNGRLVSLPCLKNLCSHWDQPASLLFDHLLIPVGADLTVALDSLLPRVEDHLPRSFDNLKNLANFTKIHISFCRSNTPMQFTGPNGAVCLIPQTFESDATRIPLESLALFDTSKTRQLELLDTNPLSEDLPYQALLPMKDLRTLTISKCPNLPFFIRALDPNLHSSDVMICPKLEDLVLCFYRKKGFNIESVTSVAAARASRGAKLKSVRIVSQVRFAPMEVMELRKHVLHVECNVGVDGVGGVGDDDDSDESD